MGVLRILGLCLLWALLNVPAHAVPANARRFSTADGLPSNVVHAVLEDRHGYLWFASDDGLARFDGRRFRTWRREQGLPDNQVLAMADDASDQIWLGTAQGQLVRLSSDRKQIEVFDAHRFPAMQGAAVLAVLPGHAGEVWFGTRGNGLFRLGADRRLRQFLPTVRGDGVPDRVIEHLAFSPDGSLWVGTPGGLARWREGRFLPPSPSLLAKAPVSSLLVDAAGQLWVGGGAGPWRGGGNARMQPLDLATEARALGRARQGGAWLADGALVWRHGGQSPRISLAALTAPLAPRFRSVFEDRHGGLWLLGRHLGVWRLPPHWQHFRREADAHVPVTAVAGMRLDAAQTYMLQCPGDTEWTLDAGAVERRQGSGQALQRWPWDPQERPRPAGPQAVHCDGSHGLWWGSRDGLRRWSGGQFAATNTSDEEVNALHVTDDGAVWAASPGVLRRYRISEAGLQHSVRIDDRHGLPPLRFHALAEDAQGALWVNSARGLLQVQPRAGRVRLYTRIDGVPAELLSARLQAQGAHMLAINDDGSAVRFNPVGLATPTAASALVVERVQVHRDGHLQTLTPRPTLTLRAHDRDLQITVRRLGPAVETQQYRFRLQGLDRDWIRVGRRGTRGFPQLPPGQFRLEFQARQPDGHWSGSEWVQLVVERGGWHHPALVGLRFGLGVMLLSGAAWITLRHLQRVRSRRRSAQRREVAEQSAQAKERYLATLGHEIRTPLTGVLGLSELLLASPLTSAQRQQLERIRQGGQTLLHVLNQALDEARIEAGSMPLQPQGIEVTALCRQWQHYNVLMLCQRGTSLAVCMHVADTARTCVDPVRVMQLLDETADILVTRTGCAKLVLQVWWQPGRERLLIEIDARPAQGVRRPGPPGLLGDQAVPTPSRQALNDALGSTQGLVRTLGGTLRLHATGPGSWKVVISLASPEVGGIGATTSMRTLLVDADPVAADANMQLLRGLGHGVVHVTHALAALAELQAGSFDVVILALDLPGVGGRALLEMIRARGSQVPVLVTAEWRCDHLALAADIRAAGGGLLHTPASAGTLHEALLHVVPGDGSS